MNTNVLAVVAVVLAAYLVPTPAAASSEPVRLSISTSKKFSAGINVDPNAKATDTGLPVFPGAEVEKESKNDDPGVNLDLWFGDYGIKLSVLKFKTNAAAAEVEDFYRSALAQHGEVLNCTNKVEEGRATISTAGFSRESKLLTCGDTKINKNARSDGKLYKAGTRSKQFGVAVQESRKGTTFQLLHFEMRGFKD